MELLKKMIYLRYKSMVIVTGSATQSESLKAFRLQRIAEYEKEIYRLKLIKHEHECRPQIIQAKGYNNEPLRPSVTLVDSI